MNVLLLGVGMQGKAALWDLARSPAVERVVAADLDFEALRAHVAAGDYGDRVRCERVDAADAASLDRLAREKPDVIIDSLPPDCTNTVAAAALAHRCHLVNTKYAAADLARFAPEAEARGVTLLPEFGLDPGIDLVLLGEAVRRLDRVEALASYGAGLPEPAAADNPLQYKISWTFAGVLNAYRRPAWLLRDGEPVELQPTDLFAPENVHRLAVDGLGELEAYPNGDALKYLEALPLERAHLKDVARYTLRWPGHCEFWKKIVDLGLLDEEPVTVADVPVDRLRYLAAALEPRLQYGPRERDLVLVRVEAAGEQAGKRVKAVYQLLDRRDLETGQSAMSRTVGYTASIGAQLIGSGEIARRGLLSPVNDVPYETFVRELAGRGIRIEETLLEEAGG